MSTLSYGSHTGLTFFPPKQVLKSCPSILRTSVCMDDELFFRSLKSEMFYGFKKAFASLEVLETAISEDINYYHHNRIKLTLKGLRPVHRTQSLA